MTYIPTMNKATDGFMKYETGYSSIVLVVDQRCWNGVKDLQFFSSEFKHPEQRNSLDNRVIWLQFPINRKENPLLPRSTFHTRLFAKDQPFMMSQRTVIYSVPG